MLQIFIIILFWISSKMYHYAHYYVKNLRNILIILKFTEKFLQLFFTFAIKKFKNIL